MAPLRIDHTDATGTLLSGTTRGDGSAAVLTGLGWRWSRQLGGWYLPRSRDTAPKRALITETAGALAAAGFAVTVAIDAAPGDQGAAEHRRTEQAQSRARRLADRAAREQVAATARAAAGRELADRIPFGQPILAGHHSQRRAERDAARIRGHLEASIDHQRRADAAQAAAATAAAGPGQPGRAAGRAAALGRAHVGHGCRRRRGSGRSGCGGGGPDRPPARRARNNVVPSSMLAAFRMADSIPPTLRGRGPSAR